MRTLLRNKRKMYYSLFSSKSMVYATDSDGNIIYDEIDGVSVARKTGSYTSGYNTPVEFNGNITGKGGVANPVEYGTSLDYDATLTMTKDEIPITENSLIWYENEPSYDDDGNVDIKTANYRVKRVPPSLNDVVYLLERLTNGKETV